MRTQILLPALALLALLGAGITASARSSPGTTVPAGFTARVDNEWFPLTPRTVYVYTGVKDGKPARDVFTVTNQTSIIAGAPCRTVHDRLYRRGRLAERTTDWYTQDRAGNVWYYGEDTVELDARGRVTSTAGTWRAGVDGANPGIFMPAQPRVGESHRQEFSKGQAEDHFRVVSLFRNVIGRPAANGLLTMEWTPLEPAVLDHKLYVRGIGDIVERTVKGGDEHLELQSVRRNG